MRLTTSVNNAEFNRALQAAAKESSRTYPQVVNGQSLALASRALRATMKADANKIAYQLGQVATQKKVSKKGRVSFKRIYADTNNTLAHKIVVARLRQRGQPIPDAAEVDRMAKRMRGARLRAVAFIRSGWVYAIRTLATQVGYRDARGGRPRAGEAARMTGTQKGYAKPAPKTSGDVAACEIANTALLQDERSPMPVALAGLNSAFAESVRDMRNHLREKLSGVFRKYNAR
jgi:hypothetical protein